MSQPAEHSKNTRAQNAWPRLRLGDAANITSGITLGRNLEGCECRLVPYLRVANVKDGRLDLTEVKTTPATEEEILACRLQPGDILLTEGGDRDKLGRGTFWNGEILECIHQNHIFRVRTDPASFDPVFLAFQFGSAYGKAYFLRHAKQTTGIASINKTVLSNFPLLSPPLPEQRRIAARLRERLAEAKKAYAAVQDQTHAVHNLPVALLRQGFRGIVPLSTAPSQPAPPGYRWCPLGQLARLESGHTPSRYHPEWWGGSIPWIALPDIRQLDGRIAEQTCECTNEAGVANSSARVLPAGTVVLSRTASVGFVTVMGRPMATSQDFVNWVCGPELDPRYLMCLFQCARDYFRSLSSGAVHKTVYMPTVKRLQVCIPPLSRQRQIAATIRAQIASTEALASQHEARLAALDHLPAALLRQAFAGNI